MSFIALIFLSLFFITGCASSEKNSSQKQPNKYPDLVRLNPPSDESAVEAGIYIDSAAVTSYNGQQTILIKGQFPDGCTQLGNAEFTLEGDALDISLDAWRDPNMMCAQVLTPFSFLYEELPEKMIRNRDTVRINGQSYQLHRD